MGDAEPEVMEIEPASKPQPGKSESTKPTHSLMWIEKYRPAGLDDLLSHHEIVATLKTLISNNRLPHLLFYGPPGTGKTSTILACARQMYGPSFKSMVLELNASDDRGINVVRDQIKSFASTRRIFSAGVKLIVLDEADAMTSAAQMALRRVVEKFAANTRFCIICNYVNKIIPALQSRCTKFRFGPLPAADVRKRVRHIAGIEGVDIVDEGIDALLTVSRGDMRRILNVLQSTHMAAMATNARSIGADAIYATTGSPHPGDITSVWNALRADDVATAADALTALRVNKGLALADIIAELLPHVRVADLADSAKIYLYTQLADIEHRLAAGGSEKLNAAALVGSCRLAAATSLDAMVS